MPISDANTPTDGRVMSLPASWSTDDVRNYHIAWNHGYQPSNRSDTNYHARNIESWRASNPDRTFPRRLSVTQVDLNTFQIVTNNHDGSDRPPRTRPQRAPSGSDPRGIMPGDEYHRPHAIPTGMPSGVCRCADCVRAYARHAGITWASHGYAPNRYVASPLPHRWQNTAFSYFGIGGEPADHPQPPSRWSELQEETPLPAALDDLINHPLRYMLRRSGRIWSAELEINNVRTDRAAQILGVERARYSERPDQPRIVASSDATVDAEIKISCMRDGSATHAGMALNTYKALYAAGARTHTNAGHHVHVDGTRLTDLGTAGVEEVMTAAWTLGFACRDALTAMAASGYNRHRGASSHWGWNGADPHKNFLTRRAALHSERLWYAANDGSDRIATMEYRLPNGTTQVLRAQAHIATAIALLDFGERATIDGDEKAAEFLRQATDRISHGGQYTQETGSDLLIEALGFSKDARKALAVSAYTAPFEDAAKRRWEDAAELPVRLDKTFALIEKEEKKASKAKPKRKPATPASRLEHAATFPEDSAITDMQEAINNYVANAPLRTAGATTAGTSPRWVFTTADAAEPATRRPSAWDTPPQIDDPTPDAFEENGPENDF